MSKDVMAVQEVSREYEFVAENPAVPVGYKRTEVGVIPRDWSVASIGEIFNLINGVAFKPSDWKQHGIPIIRIQNLNDPSASFNYSQLPVAERNHVVKGDLLFAWSGTVGTSFGARIWQGPEGVLNQHIFKVTMNEEQIHRHFALIVFSQVEDDIAKQAHGFKASFLHVKKSDLTKIKISLPQIHEQRAIATALSDVDALLEELDRLIAKKRDIKQAAMQQLLTGETRLPGFEGKWDRVCLGDIVDRLSNGAVYKPIGRGGVPITRIETIAHGCIDLERTGNAAWDASLTQYELKTGDILFSHINSVDHIGKVAIIDDVHRPIYHGMNLLLIRVKESYSSKYLFYWLDFEVTRRTMRALAKQAVSQASINTSELRTVDVYLPRRKEQDAIAVALSDIDAEIQALEQRRSKTAELKQGMMQELLTGRTRLV